MQPLETSRNVAASMGRWSARHAKTAILGWLALVVVAIAVGAAVGMKPEADNADATGESGRAEQILDQAGFPEAAGQEVVLVHSATLTADAPPFRAAVAAVVRRASSLAATKEVKSPYAQGNDDQISKDRHSALVTFQLRGDSDDDALDAIDPIFAGISRLGASHPAVEIEEVGSASVEKAVAGLVKGDLHKAEFVSLPITLVVLVLVFGALVAAGLPVLLALTAVLATTGLVTVPSQLIPMDGATSSVIVLIGLAVGVDYSLFYLRRERDERAAGRSESAALEAAAATSGRAVLVSGLAMLVAMAAMFLSGSSTFFGFAVATMLVVAFAMLGSLTVLPALLSKLGDRVNKLRVPFAHRLGARPDGGRFWGVVLRLVLRRPAVAAAVAGAALLALAAPALGMRLAVPDMEAIPRSLAVIKTYDKVEAAFPGGGSPAFVAIRAADVRSPDVRAAVAELERNALATGVMYDPIEVDVNPRGTVASVSIPIAGTGTDEASERALQRLREEVVPAALGKLRGVEYAVGGSAAASHDFNEQMKSHAPLVFLFVLGLAFLLLLVAFRSLVVAATAILLNLLSVAAAYGVLVLVFQHGLAAGLLGVHYHDGVLGWMPMFLFVVLFGLSMDYHVFILSRIREAYDRGLKTEDAVAEGIRSSAGVVTSAAVVMVAVFAVFATLSLVELKQLGIGLAAAVLLDATVVRAVLLPATMTLLGERNWYLPRSLAWLPRLRHGEPALAKAVGDR
jgi:uncharacterized membrane protein YdfJ with MMPL/SSD domain